MDIEKGIRFECQGSGNCCVSRGTYGFVYLSKKDIKKLSDGFKITEQNFVKNYCQKTDGFIHLKELKKNNVNCIFLKDNKSSLLLVVTCSQFGVSKLISKLIMLDKFFLSSSGRKDGLPLEIYCCR